MTQTIQNIANIATSLGLIVALIIFIIEFRSNKNEREYQSFIILLENYQKTVADRREQWGKLKKVVRDNPKTANEIDDEQDSISYLL